MATSDVLLQQIGYVAATEISVLIHCIMRLAPVLKRLCLTIQGAIHIGINLSEFVCWYV